MNDTIEQVIERLTAELKIADDLGVQANINRHDLRALLAERDRLQEALEEIAKDYKTYLGHGDFTEDAMSGREAQKIARAALTAGEPHAK